MVVDIRRVEEWRQIGVIAGSHLAGGMLAWLEQGLPVVPFAG